MQLEEIMMLIELWVPLGLPVYYKAEDLKGLSDLYSKDLFRLHISYRDKDLPGSYTMLPLCYRDEDL